MADDKEQVTLDAIGQRIEDVQRLIATDLQSIPNSHLYDGTHAGFDLPCMLMYRSVLLRR